MLSLNSMVLVLLCIGAFGIDFSSAAGWNETCNEPDTPAAIGNPKSGKAEGTCDDGLLCQENRCACNTTAFQAWDPVGEKCNGGFGASCKTDKECVSQIKCVTKGSTCGCDEDHLFQGDKCVKTAHLMETCNRDIVCTAGVNHVHAAWTYCRYPEPTGQDFLTKEAECDCIPGYIHATAPHHGENEHDCAEARCSSSVSITSSLSLILTLLLFCLGRSK